ncbi:hypothetical protein Tco_0066082 [Tanacetum coccineum]
MGLLAANETHASKLFKAPLGKVLKGVETLEMSEEDAFCFKHECDIIVLLLLFPEGIHLRIKESLRMQDSDKTKGNNVAGPSVFNMVEHNNSSRYNDNKDDDVVWWVDLGATVHVCKDRC